VSARAGVCAPQERGPPASSCLLRAFGTVILAVSSACLATPASAEIGATISFFNDARFRGFSVSDEDPIALLDLSYDAPSGVYLAASGAVVASSDGVHPLALKLNGGYARRLPSGIALDAGIVHSRYSHYSTLISERSYTELYGGVAWKSVSARLYVSPHYFETDSPTLYGELENSLHLTPKLSLNGHVGLLVALRSEGRPTFDWRLGLTRQFGPISAHASWTGRGRMRRYDDAYTRPTNALVFGVSCAL
jgi:uncharacterized protein (TIGR02001 family)